MNGSGMSLGHSSGSHMLFLCGDAYACKMAKRDLNRGLAPSVLEEASAMPPLLKGGD